MGKKLKCFFNKSIGFFVPRKQKSSIYSRAKEENFRNAIVKDDEDNDSMRSKTLEDLELLKVLGHGKLGKVFLARERGTSNCYAVKTLKLPEKEDARSLGEVRIMENTNHPFFVSLVKTFRTCSELHLVMEFAIGGDLEFHLTKFGAFDSMRTRFYAAEIVLGIDYLHQRNIVHRDLKLENIMLSRDGHVKIADFGLSQEVPMCGSSVCGTPLYMAPEIVLKLGYGAAVDWWSLGIVIYRMLYGKKPFKSTNRTILFTQITDSEISYPRGIDRDGRDLLQGLLRKNPHKRLGGGPRGAKEIKKHSFFASINWAMLLEKKLVPPFVPDLASNEDTSYFYDFYTDKNIELVKKYGLRPRVTYKSGHFC